MRLVEVMAIDASLTGFTVHLSGTKEEVHFWTTKPPVRDKQGRLPSYLSGEVPSLEGRLARYRYLADKAVALAKEHAPALCLIEGYAFNAKGNSGISLGELGGILRDRLVGYPMVTIEPTPTELKKFCAGKGNASKVEVASALSSRYGGTFKTDNHADAFGLARLGMCILGFEEAQTKQQTEVVLQLKRSVDQAQE